HAGDGSDDMVQSAQVIVGVNDLSNLLIKGGDLGVEGLEHLIDASAGGGGSGGGPSVGLFGADLEQLPSTGDQCIEFTAVFLAFHCQAWRGMSGESGQHPGVEGVGLGVQAQGLGEVSDLG